VRRWLVAAALGSGVAAAAYWRKALTFDGAIAAAVVGAVVFARGGPRAALAVIAFFVSSSALSRVGQDRKRSAALAQVKGAQRDAWQVLANGGIATCAIAVKRDRAFVGALAAAAADTWATELGLLARSGPRLITTLNTVPAGTSGGITLEGLVASLGGALLVGIAAQQPARAVGAGLGGSVIDSLLGATLQAAYTCDACGATTEEPFHRACQAPAHLTKGAPWANNDTVNALATLSGALIATLV
jgi:uncharacterized protein (TIGR00297 family)